MRSAFKRHPIYRAVIAMRDAPGCQKKPFAMQADAERYAEARQRRWGRQRAYVCRECGCWHLTSR
jgi:hypothetical protein